MKAASNLRKHGVSFEQAQRVFEDPSALSFEDDRSNYGESRFIQIGAVQDRLLTVVYSDHIGKAGRAAGAAMVP